MLPEDITYLEDIRDAADRAVIHAIGLTPDGLAQNVYVQDGVVRCLILIGEAARQISADARAAFSDLDWSGMIGLRNILVHRYREVDYMELWQIVNRELPPLVDRLKAYLSQFE